MGYGGWSTNVYSAAASLRATTGKSDFDYSDSGNRTVHSRLNPFNAIRESRDSDEHPESLAIAVLFDVTGSMNSVPRTLQKKLPTLFGLLTGKGYVEHPQILFGAIGDATCDKVPLQVGQFESNNAMDDDLGTFVLEGGGGGQMTESYELGAYFMARHTRIDCLEKRGRRGYLFIIGDEMPYKNVSLSRVSKLIGDSLSGQLTTTEIMEELQRKYHVYYILPKGSTYVGNRQVLDTWKEILGQQVIELDDLDAVCETIALTIGLSEGTVDLDTGLGHLRDVGSTAVSSVGSALATVVKGTVAKGPALTPARTDDDGVERL